MLSVFETCKKTSVGGSRVSGGERMIQNQFKNVAEASSDRAL